MREFGIVPNDPVEYARILIRPGFDPLDDVLGYMREWAEDSADVSAEEAEAAARQVWQQCLDEQRYWTGPGDYDRMSRAFAELDARGVLGRMNFACCRNCAMLEIDFERTPHPDPPDWYRYQQWAYVLFTEETAAVLAKPDAELMLDFSAFRAAADTPQEWLDAADTGNDEAERRIHHHTDQAVGRLVVDALNRHGLVTSWADDPTVRIGVHIDEWRKRLPE